MSSESKLIGAQFSEQEPEPLQQELFQRLDLQPRSDAGLLFGFRDGKLSLWQNSRQAPSPTCVDFESSDMQYRLRSSGRRQGLARAVGLHRRSGLSILDVTAGLGKDAFILAALGAKVTLVERSALIHALLVDGLDRARQSSLESIRTAVGRMMLLHADAVTCLKGEDSSEHCDVLYLDPMYPPRRKSAGVRKDIASLQLLLGPDQDSDQLFQAALESGVPRIVLKRPLHQSKGNTPPASFQVKGKNSRFDVYVRSRDSIAE